MRRQLSPAITAASGQFLVGDGVRTVIGVQQIVAASRFVFYTGAGGTFTPSSKTTAQPVF
jgi:hypothetical protein